MRMNQDERRFDFHGLGAALKRAREEKGWTQAYVAELVDLSLIHIFNFFVGVGKQGRIGSGQRIQQLFNFCLHLCQLHLIGCLLYTSRCV